MPSNPKDSEWYATSQERRARKVVSVTLSDEARERLDELCAESSKPRSVVVEGLILNAPKKGKR